MVVFIMRDAAATKSQGAWRIGAKYRCRSPDTSGDSSGFSANESPLLLCGACGYRHALLNCGLVEEAF